MSGDTSSRWVMVASASSLFMRQIPTVRLSPVTRSPPQLEIEPIQLRGAPGDDDVAGHLAHDRPHAGEIEDGKEGVDRGQDGRSPPVDPVLEDLPVGGGRDGVTGP